MQRLARIAEPLSVQGCIEQADLLVTNATTSNRRASKCMAGVATVESGLEAKQRQDGNSPPLLGGRLQPHGDWDKCLVQ